MSCFRPGDIVHVRYHVISVEHPEQGPAVLTVVGDVALSMPEEPVAVVLQEWEVFCTELPEQPVAIGIRPEEVET